jgi:hypothetical protein
MYLADGIKTGMKICATIVHERDLVYRPDEVQNKGEIDRNAGTNHIQQEIAMNTWYQSALCRGRS